MSDYNPTYTYQWRDYEAARKERKRTGDNLIKAPLITEERPNPLSVELRIVLVYFWSTYKACLELARQAYRGSSQVAPAMYRTEAEECLAHVRILCYDLFAVTSRFHPFHIHSEYGCNDEDCPAWKRGFETAQENVLDWYDG